MGSTDDAISLVRANIDAFNRGDKEKFKAQLTPESVYREHGTGREEHGVDAITATSWSWRDAFPDSHGEIVNAFGSGDQVALQIIWTGTQTGDLVGPAGSIPATGKQVQVPACQVVRMRDGEIVSVDHYFDSMSMLVQLGVAPAQQPA
jgi:steroid delta-isomerase-like uncharacterized protein